MDALTYIYAHIDPTKLNFSDQLNQSNFTFSELPDYAFVSFEQIKKITGKTPIVLTNEFINNEFSKEIQEFFELCKQGMPSFYKDTFWLTTLLRLYIVYLYCQKNNVNVFIHLEYDNLIFSDFSYLQSLKPGVYFTKVGEYYSSAGFIYCNSLQRYEWFIIRLKQLLKKGENSIKQFTPEGFLSEMVLINLIGKHTRDIISYLPSLPYPPANDNFDDLGVVFDGASYGQYLGGTNNGNPQGWAGKHHYVGQELLSNNIKVFFDKALKKPFLSYKDKNIPIHNLHVHSKNLKHFANNE